VSDDSPFELHTSQIEKYQQDGHLTVNRLFSDEQIAEAVADIEQWQREFMAALQPEQKKWYLEGVGNGEQRLRKLDNPVFHRPVFLQFARHPPLVRCVEQLIGPGLRVWFSQVFMKPPGGGGPKPVHQDNFYFGPSNLDGVITVWIALDEATIQNGCLYYGNGSNRGDVLPHVAPPDEPFNLQLSREIAATIPMTPAPVSRGGVSFHHGNTLHQSSNNRSDHPRRAVAIHYVNAETDFETPALEYDSSIVVSVS
jgi:phytanoyl-CoA hydroxylase